MSAISQASIQSREEGRMLWISQGYTLYRSGTPQLVDQGLPGLTILLWVKFCHLPKVAVPSKHLLLCKVAFGAKFEDQQAEENRQLKPLSSQRPVLEVSCSFSQIPTNSELLASSFPRKIPAFRDSSPTETRIWAAAVSQEVAPPQGGLLVSRLHIVLRNLSAAVTPYSKRSQFLNKSSSGMIIKNASVRYILIPPADTKHCSVLPDL